MSKPPDISDLTKEEVIETLKEIRHPFDVAVFSSENYFNMASLIRTGHNFLCRQFWMIDFDKFYRKATMGAHKYETINKVTTEEFLERTKDRNIIAFEKRHDLDTKDIRTFKYPENPILLFGSEKYGVPEILLQRANAVVSIPMFGIQNDHNISVAAGIAMYDYICKSTI